MIFLLSLGIGLTTSTYVRDNAATVMMKNSDATVQMKTMARVETLEGMGMIGTDDKMEMTIPDEKRRQPLNITSKVSLVTASEKVEEKRSFPESDDQFGNDPDRPFSPMMSFAEDIKRADGGRASEEAGQSSGEHEAEASVSPGKPIAYEGRFEISDFSESEPEAPAPKHREYNIYRDKYGNRYGIRSSRKVFRDDYLTRESRELVGYPIFGRAVLSCIVADCWTKKVNFAGFA